MRLRDNADQSFTSDILQLKFTFLIHGSRIKPWAIDAMDIQTFSLLLNSMTVNKNYLFSKVSQTLRPPFNPYK